MLAVVNRFLAIGQLINHNRGLGAQGQLHPKIVPGEHGADFTHLGTDLPSAHVGQEIHKLYRSLKGTHETE